MIRQIETVIPVLKTIITRVVAKPVLQELLTNQGFIFDIVEYEKNDDYKYYYFVLKKYITWLIKNMMKLTDLEFLDKTDADAGFVIYFLGYYISNGAYYLDDFHWNYIINRSKFNRFGGSEIIGEDGKLRKKMMIIVMCFL